MVSVLGLADDAVDALIAECNDGAASEADHVRVSNYLAPGNRAIGGTASALERLCALADKHGAKKATRLKVSGAFHTPHMRSAVDALEQAVAQVPLQMPEIPVLCNVTGEPYTSTAEIRRNLVRHLTEPVKWQQSIELILDAPFAVGETIELGSGSVLSGLMRHILRRRKAENPEASEVKVTNLAI